MKYILLITFSSLIFQSWKDKIDKENAMYKIADRLCYLNFINENNLYQYYIGLNNINTDSNLYFIRSNTPDTFKTILQKELKGKRSNDRVDGIFPLSDTTYIIDPDGKLKEYGIVKQDKYVFVFSKNNTKPIKQICYQLLYTNEIIYDSLGAIKEAYFLNCNGMDFSKLSFNTTEK